MYHWLKAGRECLSRYRRKNTFTFLSKSFPSLLLALAILYGCSTADSSTSLEGPSPELSPEEELKTFVVERGLKVQLVASEPMVQDPVVSTFDEDGRLWVVEMRAYMPNMEGEGEREPNGRISVLEDVDGDGVMDKSSVFLDSLVMPRAVAVVAGGALVAFEEALWMAHDTNGDLKADSTTLIDKDYAGSTLPEHAGNGLWRGVDNWYYNAKSRLRYRSADGDWIRDSTEFRGQWGISHDDVGRLYYNYNWSQLHADLVPPNYLTRNRNYVAVSGIDKGLTLDRRVYPIRPTPAVNRGYIPGILDEAKKLKEFTAACSPLIYRGTALPEAYYGDAFVCEPSGNLIKRNIIERGGLELAARDPHPGTEFFASTDERFRPVHLASGPDGALYVLDMYRGLIQHKAYVTPYLREQTLSRKLVQPIHRGRIWRVVPENWKSPKPVKLSKADGMQLAAYLSSPDGWYRDMAQRLLVERGDSNVVAALEDLAMNGKESLGRFHALWTLEGMGHTPVAMLFDLLDDKDATVSKTALRILEPLANEDASIRRRLENALLGLWKKAPIEQSLQIAFTAEKLSPEVSFSLLAGIATQHDSSAVMRDAVMSSLEDRELAFMKKLLAMPEWKTSSPTKEIFLETITGAIVRKRDPRELKTLLALLNVGPSDFGWRERAMLTGMSIQGYTGKIPAVKLPSAPAILSRHDLDIPESQKEGLRSLFQWPGSISADTAVQKGHTLNEKEKQSFALGRKLYLNSCSGCHGNDGDGLNRFAPPLRGSEWVLGDSRRLILILLHGIEGPLEVAGKRYAEPAILPVMPGHATLGDVQISAILTYIRNEWGNKAGAVDRQLVGRTRITNQGRVLPWTAEELNAHMQSLDDEPVNN